MSTKYHAQFHLSQFDATPCRNVVIPWTFVDILRWFVISNTDICLHEYVTITNPNSDLFRGAFIPGEKPCNQQKWYNIKSIDINNKHTKLNITNQNPHEVSKLEKHVYALNVWERSCVFTNGLVSNGLPVYRLTFDCTWSYIFINHRNHIHWCIQRSI